MNISVVGTGHVGLVTGAVFADLGNDVLCVDKQADKISGLQAGRMPLYEPGLEEMVARNVADQRLSFTLPLERPMIITDVPSAEMIKYASNAFGVPRSPSSTPSRTYASWPAPTSCRSPRVWVSTPGSVRPFSRQA